jgi:hypothetical protein
MKRGKGKKVKSKIRRVRSDTGFFKSSASKNLEQFIIASVITGVFTGMGATLGTILAKYLLNEVDQNVPVPISLHDVIVKEAQ